MSKPIESIRWQGKDAIVAVVGEVDLHRSTDLQQGLLEVLEAKPRRIVIDLSGVPYMDSSGVASLVKLLSRARKTGLELKLAALTPKVLSILEITRLDSVFTVCETVDAALAED